MEFVKVRTDNVGGKAIVESLDDGKVYIIPAIGFHLNQEIKLDLTNAIELPSLLYAIAVLYDSAKVKDGIKFIKENW